MHRASHPCASCLASPSHAAALPTTMTKPEGWEPRQPSFNKETYGCHHFTSVRRHGTLAAWQLLMAVLLLLSLPQPYWSKKLDEADACKLQGRLVVALNTDAIDPSTIFTRLKLVGHLGAKSYLYIADCEKMMQHINAAGEAEDADTAERRIHEYMTDLMNEVSHHKGVLHVSPDSEVAASGHPDDAPSPPVSKFTSIPPPNPPNFVKDTFTLTLSPTQHNGATPNAHPRKNKRQVDTKLPPNSAITSNKQEGNMLQQGIQVDDHSTTEIHTNWGVPVQIHASHKGRKLLTPLFTLPPGNYQGGVEETEEEEAVVAAAPGPLVQSVADVDSPESAPMAGPAAAPLSAPEPAPDSAPATAPAAVPAPLINVNSEQVVVVGFKWDNLSDVLAHTPSQSNPLMLKVSADGLKPETTIPGSGQSETAVPQTPAPVEPVFVLPETDTTNKLPSNGDPTAPTTPATSVPETAAPVPPPPDAPALVIPPPDTLAPATLPPDTPAPVPPPPDIPTPVPLPPDTSAPVPPPPDTPNPVPPPPDNPNPVPLPPDTFLTEPPLPDTPNPVPLPPDTPVAVTPPPDTPAPVPPVQATPAPPTINAPNDITNSNGTPQGPMDVTNQSDTPAGEVSPTPPPCVQSETPDAPNDCLFAEQPNMVNVSIIPVWTAGITGSSAVKVCIVDSGVNCKHPELSPNCVLEDAIDYSNWENMGNWPTGEDVVDNFFHGTHVSGIIGAVGNNSLGVAGISWQVSLGVCKAFDGPTAWMSSILRCINYCREQGYLIISFPHVSPSDASMFNSIQNLMEDGGLIIVSAGNQNINVDTNAAESAFPSAFTYRAWEDNLISVTAVDNDGELADFGWGAANWGKQSVDLAAPGKSILSISNEGDSYRHGSGTSMAVPHVVGAVAIIRSFLPTLHPACVKAAILQSVDPLPSLRDRTVSGGQLNVSRALEYARTQPCIPPTPPPTPVPQQVCCFYARNTTSNDRYCARYGLEGQCYKN